jgi:RimJ/RimL family protein N-acetyltransferase
MGDGSREGHGGHEVIHTARLVLRRCTPADLPAMSVLSADHAVAENLCAAISQAGRGAYAVTERGDGMIVGCAGYGATQDQPGTIEISLWIGAPWWGRGYGTEAAQALIDCAFSDERVDSLWCSNRVTNVRARRVIEKCGFQFRGTGMVRSPTFFGAFPVERFILDRRNWASLKAWGAPASGAEHGRPQRETAA